MIPTQFPDIPDIDADETPTSTAALPVFPPPPSTTIINTHTPATMPASQEITSDPQVTESPIVPQPVSESTATTATASETAQPISPDPQSPFTSLSHVLDLIAAEDQSDSRRRLHCR